MESSRYRSAGLLAAGAVAGAVLAGTIGANAAGSGSATPSYGSSAPAQAPQGYGGAHQGRGGGHAGETALTGTNAQEARAAALKAVPGGTVDRVETDSGDAAYEAHMTKSDGTHVTVKFDKNFTVTGVEDGMGK